jgi:hypothetical protein
MSRFAATLGEQRENVTVTMVLQASQLRYVNQYIRTNGIEHEVHYDREGSLAAVNGLIQAPVALLLHDNRVVAAHYPSPSLPDASDVFYEAVLDALER